MFCLLFLSSTFLFAQDRSFMIDQLGIPLKEAVSNIYATKKIEPTLKSDFGTVDYWGFPFAKWKTTLQISSFDSIVYRIDLYVGKRNKDNEMEIYYEILRDLSDKYGTPHTSDPDEKYRNEGLTQKYLKIAHWKTGMMYTIRLTLSDELETVHLRYTQDILFDRFIKELIEERKQKRTELLKDY